MTKNDITWDKSEHSASKTDDYVFSQLIPYIGNKRKLLGLIQEAIEASDARPETHDFVDLFAGTGVVSRFARQLGFRTLANDWEPYSEIINRCYLELSEAPLFFGDRTYLSVLDELNALPPLVGWITRHLCPDDDDNINNDKDRLFFMRKNGQRIDAIRERIAEWDAKGLLSPQQRAALLAPLLYQCCYASNTSGVFKGFHNGWGGQTGTALYRIKGDLALHPALFFNNGKQSRVFREDAESLASHLHENLENPAFVYLDPPYNQHPYGANYHVLNSVALWDKPPLAPKIQGRGDKAAIRHDWRTERRSAYNYRAEATRAYTNLLASLPAAWIATSYSTDGMIALEDLVAANVAIGSCRVFVRGYKRYRVSSQRFSEKPMNVEFVLLTDTQKRSRVSAEDIVAQIRAEETRVLKTHAGKSKNA